MLFCIDEDLASPDISRSGTQILQILLRHDTSHCKKASIKLSQSNTVMENKVSTLQKTLDLRYVTGGVLLTTDNL